MIADDQHADLAQHQHADHVDDIDVGAEVAEMENALLRDDGADQEGDEQDDRHRAPADPVEMMHDRSEAEAAWMRDHAEHRQHQRAEKLHDQRQRAADLGDGAADRHRARRGSRWALPA